MKDQPAQAFGRDQARDEEACADSLAGFFGEVRRRSEALVGRLSDEDCGVQSMPEASPAKWHLAHTTWFLETLVLRPRLRGYQCFDEAYAYLFNSYYDTIGPMHPRPLRGMLTRPSRAEVMSYRNHVDRGMAHLLSDERVMSDARLRDVVLLGLHHEQQHQELLLTDIKHAFASNPLEPAYLEGPLPSAQSAAELSWQRRAEGVRTIGHDGRGFAFDNESPRHRRFVAEFEIASRPVTNGEFADFIRDDGYRRPELWLSDGWARVQADGWQAPLYWRGGEDEPRSIFTLRGRRQIDPDTPVCHISYYEADAFARWAEARLPAESEWEAVAEGVGGDGRFVEDGDLHPLAAGPGDGGELLQLFGDVWEWTASPYTPYPGYRPTAGALGEYNGKFMSGQMVLRGGSCATPRTHIRATYRNFFPPDARWQFSGLRLARDTDAPR